MRKLSEKIEAKRKLSEKSQKKQKKRKKQKKSEIKRKNRLEFRFAEAKITTTSQNSK